MSPTWTVEAFSDGDDCPLDRWLDSIDPNVAVMSLLAAKNILGRLGLDACKTEWAKPLGDGLWEFRVRHTPETLARRTDQDPIDGMDSDKLLLRLFFTTAPGYVILLVGGLDKGSRSAKSAQNQAIKLAREAKRRSDLQRKRGSS